MEANYIARILFCIKRGHTAAVTVLIGFWNVFVTLVLCDGITCVKFYIAYTYKQYGKHAYIYSRPHTLLKVHTLTQHNPLLRVSAMPSKPQPTT